MTNVVSAPPAPLVRSERTPIIDHGTYTSQWSPEGGGSVHIERDGASTPAFHATLGAGTAAFIGMQVARNSHGKAVRSAVSAAGGTAAEAAAAVLKAKVGWGAASMGVLALTAVAAGLLADRFGTPSTTTVRASRQDYERGKQWSDQTITPSLSAQGITMGTATAGFTVAGAGAAALLSRIPKVNLVAGVAGAVAIGLAGAVGGAWLGNKIVDGLDV